MSTYIHTRTDTVSSRSGGRECRQSSGRRRVVACGHAASQCHCPRRPPSQSSWDWLRWWARFELSRAARCWRAGTYVPPAVAKAIRNKLAFAASTEYIKKVGALEGAAGGTIMLLDAIGPLAGVDAVWVAIVIVCDAAGGATYCAISRIIPVRE